MSTEREERVRRMLARRLGSVAVVVEAVHRRHNTSAILRSAEAFGAHQVHLITGGFRTSKGAARGAERWLELRYWPDTASCAAHLRAEGFALWVADLHEQARSPDAVPVESPVAILFGNELNGVSDAARALADGFVIVPMHGLTESLNVSVAAACVLQRVCERRRALAGADLPAAAQEAFFARWLAQEERLEQGIQARVG